MARSRGHGTSRGRNHSSSPDPWLLLDLFDPPKAEPLPKSYTRKHRRSFSPVVRSPSPVRSLAYASAPSISPVPTKRASPRSDEHEPQDKDQDQDQDQDDPYPAAVHVVQPKSKRPRTATNPPATTTTTTPSPALTPPSKQRTRGRATVSPRMQVKQRLSTPAADDADADISSGLKKTHTHAAASTPTRFSSNTKQSAPPTTTSHGKETSTKKTPTKRKSVPHPSSVLPLDVPQPPIKVTRSKLYGMHSHIANTVKELFPEIRRRVLMAVVDRLMLDASRLARYRSDSLTTTDLYVGIRLLLTQDCIQLQNHAQLFLDGDVTDG